MAYFGKRGWILGHILGEITDLEFENHKNVTKCIFRTLKQAGTNICSLGYQNSNSKIGLSFSVARKNILNKVHILHWDICIDHLVRSGNSV